jgi:outer membrane lipoprotein-sorting protein/predicted small secreted protein
MERSDMNKRPALLTVTLLLLLTALLSACNASQGISMSGADILRKVRDTMRDSKTSESVFSVEMAFNKEGLRTLIGDFMNLTGMPKGGTGMAMDESVGMLPERVSFDLKAWKENPNKGRLELTSSTIPGIGGTALVSDGTKIYVYIPLEETLKTATLSELEVYKDMYSGMMYGFDDPEVAFEKMLEVSDVVAVSQEQMGGRDAYKVEARPKADAAERLGLPAIAEPYLEPFLKGAVGTLWVDKELFTPLRGTLTHPQIGTLKYEGKWKLNDPIPAERWVLQVPAGTTTVDMDESLRMTQSMQDYMPKTVTLPEARELAKKEGWTLLEPSYLPEGATLLSVLVTTPKADASSANSSDPTNIKSADMSNFVFHYSASRIDFSLMQEKFETPIPRGSLPSDEHAVFVSGGYWSEMPVRPAEVTADSPPPTAIKGSDIPTDSQFKSETVKVQGVEGTLVTNSIPGMPNFLSLSWPEDDNTRMVSISGNITKEELLKIAEGLK